MDARANEYLTGAYPSCVSASVHVFWTWFIFHGLELCEGFQLASSVWSSSFRSAVTSFSFLSADCSSMLTSCNVNPRHILLIAHLIYYYTSHPSWNVQLIFTEAQVWVEEANQSRTGFGSSFVFTCYKTC